MSAESRRPSPAAITVGIPPGATTLLIKGRLSANQDAEYVVGDERGTVFMAHAESPTEDLDVSVYRADTRERLRDEQPSNPWLFMARLPETMGYLVAVKGKGEPTDYRLELEAPRTVIFDDQGAAEFTQDLPANGVLHFLVPPAAHITAELTSAPADAFLTAHGLAGQQLMSAEQGGRTFTGQAPQPNEELVVRVNQGATGGAFTLAIRRK